jgi:hypothetical protein
MTKKDYIYLGIIIALSISLLFLIFERKGQTNVCYEVFEEIINKP